VNASDRLFLERAFELARRGVGSTSPNPPVGAVLVRDGAIIGEGYHHRAGADHAEIEALRAANDASGATLYVTLEPCNHIGKTPPCAAAFIQARIARAVIGTCDPNPLTAGAGIAALKAAGIEVEILDTPPARELIEPFKTTIRVESRPYVALKMASSQDGFITSGPHQTQWLTGEQSRGFVRELRIAHDAVMVGAGTVRVDDPLLTVRPMHGRGQPYTRIVLCETESVAASSRVFTPVERYERTIVVAPAGSRTVFTPLEDVADVLYVGRDGDVQLDLRSALRSLRERGVTSILCEGGPTLAARLLEADCIDRVYWLTAPMKLAAPGAVPVLARTPNGTLPSIEFERVEPLGEDMLATGIVRDV